MDVTTVTIDPKRTLGPIRAMNAVNNGPSQPNVDHVVWKRPVRIRLADGARFGKARCHLTDSWRTYTEVPAEVGRDGSVVLLMEPCSFALLEW